MVVLGCNAVLLRNRGTYADPDWVVVDGVREAQLRWESGEADLTTRAAGGWRSAVPTVRLATIELEVLWESADLDLDAIRQAYLAHLPLDLLVLDGAGFGREGMRAAFRVTRLETDQALDGPVTCSATLQVDALVQAPYWVVTSEMVGWQHYKEVTISDAAVDADLFDFPLLVAFDGDADVGASARPDGWDIRFTTGDGAQELAFERESFSVAGGLASGRFWVRVPRINSTLETTIRMYYGCPAAQDAQQPSAVWDAGYLWVSHMRDRTASEVLASVGQHGRKTGTGEPVEVDALVGKGQSFVWDGAIDCGPVTPDAWTLEMLFKGPGQANGLLLHWGNEDMKLELTDGAGNMVLRLGGNAERQWPPSVTSQIVDGNWHHVALYVPGSLQGDISAADLYVDGVLQTPSSTTDTGDQDAKNGNLRLGYLNGSYPAASGVWDEVRISGEARRSEWIKFAAANMLHAGHELTFGAEQ